jgi:hypothetical protein
VWLFICLIECTDSHLDKLVFQTVALFSRKIALATSPKTALELHWIEMGYYAFQCYVQPNNIVESLALETYYQQYSFCYFLRFSTSSLVFLAFAC